MPSPTPPERFAKCWSEAMLGYANATNAAYWAMTSQALSFWGDTARTAMGSRPGAGAAADSWYRPERPVRTALLPPPAAAQSAWGFPRYDAMNPFAPAGGAIPNPLSVWFDMLPLRGGPAAWQMAFAMLASGVPRQIAWPTAEANAAMIDAAQAAKDTVDTVFSSFRTDGGHASTVPRYTSRLMSAIWVLPLSGFALASAPGGWTSWQI